VRQQNAAQALYIEGEEFIGGGTSDGKERKAIRVVMTLSHDGSQHPPGGLLLKANN